LDDKDIIGFSQEKNRLALYIFVMRKGKVSESESVLIEEDAKIPPADSLSRLVHRFYRKRMNWPDKILLPFQPAHRQKLQDEIRRLAKKNIILSIPYKGKNKKLVELADRNAEIVLQESKQETQPLKEAHQILSLAKIPRRIEGFDVSNTGGEESVGSVVVFDEGHPRKQDYRKFRIKTVKGPDDVASLREIIRRRYTRLKKENKRLPDLILVDGGKGQLNAAQSTLKQLGLEKLPVISLAKKDEIIYTPSRTKGIKLGGTSPALKLFQHIRDEAHRFAISYHRAERKMRTFESELDGIPGLGPKRKSLLFARYKNLDEIKESSQDELAKIIGKKLAAEILQKLNRINSL
jgi:excinuclease ABC subunit C